MVVDRLENLGLYSSLNPRMERVLQFLSENDLATLAAGSYPIEDKMLFVNVVDAELKSLKDAKIEVHNDYIDLQVVLAGEESFGWSPRAELQAPRAEFDKERDIQFFDDAHQILYPLQAGQFTILMPEDGHAPLIGSGRVRKAIFKIHL